MGNVVNFNKGNKPDIEIENTDAFLTMALKLSNFIKDLSLTTTKNNELVWLVIDQVTQAKKDAFSQGYQLGLKLGHNNNNLLK